MSENFTDARLQRDAASQRLGDLRVRILEISIERKICAKKLADHDVALWPGHPDHGRVERLRHRKAKRSDHLDHGVADRALAVEDQSVEVENHGVDAGERFVRHGWGLA